MICEVCPHAAVRSLTPCHRVRDQRTREPAKRRSARRSSMPTANSSDAPAITYPSSNTLSVTTPTKSASAMLTITRRLFKMFLLLSHINARIDPNIPTKWIPRFPAIFSIRRELFVRTAREKRFQNATRFKSEMPRSAQGLKRQRDFNEAVGLQVALLIGSDRYGRRFCAAGRRPRGRRMFVARSLFHITSPLHNEVRSRRSKMDGGNREQAIQNEACGAGRVSHRFGGGRAPKPFDRRAELVGTCS